MYYNRDLSWLEFNYRVLQESASDNVPLYERLKFMAIHAANLDEFFSVRYPVIIAMANLSEKTLKKAGKDLGLYNGDEIKAEAERQLQATGKLLTETLIPQLANNNINLYYNRPLLDEHIGEVKNIFLSKVLAFIQPLHLDTLVADNFQPENNKIYVVVTVQKEGEDEINHYLVKIPSESLERFYTLTEINDQRYIIFIDDIVKNNLGYIFQGYNIIGSYSIKINRDAELDLEEDLTSNIIKKIEKQLKKREDAPISRFLYQYDMPDNLLMFMKSIFKIEDPYTFAGGKYHNLRDLFHLPYSDKTLRYIPWQSLMPSTLPQQDKLFSTINKTDILLHLPYQSYNLILSFFNQAAVDPDVEEIFITLYRVAADSLIVNSLMSAVKNGKKVTAFVELKARFDEANNISWSKKMKDAGINMIYSIPGIKVHSKIALVTRKVNNKKKMYSLLGTGNFNEVSANNYSDHILITADKGINGELLTLFRFLEQRSLPENKDILEFDKICVSQFNMVKCFEGYIDKEIQKVKRGKKGLIRIKLNNLEDPGMIDRLYKAGKAGVKVHLIIRGICVLIPDPINKIEVKRLVGRYLEHTRILIFGEPGQEEVLIGSADWMTRNLYGRIEVCVPVTDIKCKRELVDYFDVQWQTVTNTQQEGTVNNTFIINSDSDAQQAVYKYLKDKA